MVRVPPDRASEALHLFLDALSLADELYGWTPEEAATRDGWTPSNKEASKKEAFSEVLLTRARRAIAEVEVRPDDVKAMLAKAGARSAPDFDALDDIAYESTLRAVQLRHQPQKRSQSVHRQATNAVATLRRVLPEIIDRAEGLERDPRRAFQYRVLPAALSQSLDFTPPIKRLTWHTAARALAGLYKLHIDPAAGWSAHGPAVRFLELALRRVGVKSCTRAAIEKALDPKRHPNPDPYLACCHPKSDAR
jgi:hypothetical protein